MTRKNPYYGRCVYLKWIYAKQTALCNSYSKVKGVCKIYQCNVYDIHLKDDNVMCCVNVSPYTKKNCLYFKDKDNQRQLGDF